MRKALLAGAFFIACSLPLQAACPRLEGATPVKVRQVFDGDTVELMDQRRLRLIGVNTPELGKKGRPDEPLAAAARQAVQAWVRQQPLWLVPGVEAKDRYGRLLGHLYLADGQSLEERLLEQGYGFLVAIAPNLALFDCLQQAEQRAVAAGRGVWATALATPRVAADLNDDAGGYRFVAGVVTRVQPGEQAWYLELDDQVALQLPLDLVQVLGRSYLSGLQGQRLTARGWLVDRRRRGAASKRSHKRWLMRISHPHQLIPAP